MELKCHYSLENKRWMFTVRSGACLHARAKGKHLFGLGVDCPSGGDGAWTWGFRVCFGSVCTVFVSVVSCLFLCVRLGHHHHQTGNISASSRCGGLSPPTTFPASGWCPHASVVLGVWVLRCVLAHSWWLLGGAWHPWLGQAPSGGRRALRSLVSGPGTQYALAYQRPVEPACMSPQIPKNYGWDPWDLINTNKYTKSYVFCMYVIVAFVYYYITYCFITFLFFWTILYCGIIMSNS